MNHQEMWRIFWTLLASKQSPSRENCGLLRSDPAVSDQAKKLHAPGKFMELSQAPASSVSSQEREDQSTPFYVPVQSPAKKRMPSRHTCAHTPTYSTFRTSKRQSQLKAFLGTSSSRSTHRARSRAWGVDLPTLICVRFFFLCVCAS